MTGILQKKKEIASKNPQYPDPCGSIEISTCADKIWCKSREWAVAASIPNGATVEYELTGEMTSGQWPSPILASIRQSGGKYPQGDPDKPSLPSTVSANESRDIGVYTSYAKDILVADKAKDCKDAVDMVFTLREMVAERLSDPFENE